MNPSQGVIVADRYRLERPLGKGGMGEVWAAYHVGLRIPCAVKFILAQAASNPAIRARFEREAVSAAQLRSPNVVQILDHGIWEETPYIAMEMLEGEDLNHRLQRVRTLPPADVFRIVSQVCRALSRAHALGLVHRDLKPANIFLVEDDDQEIAKVLDFGIAKITDELTVSSQTKTGALLGTPYYMSPEQAQGSRDVDHRSDLWAIAVLTYQCLVGALPFDADALGELFVRIMVRPLPIPSEVAAGRNGPVLPKGFDAWWQRAASREREARFQTPKELADALAVALGITAVLGGVSAAMAPPVPAASTDQGDHDGGSTGSTPKPEEKEGSPAAITRWETLEPSAPTGTGSPGEAAAPMPARSASIALTSGTPLLALGSGGVSPPIRSRAVWLVVGGLTAAALTAGSLVAWRAPTKVTEAPVATVSAEAIRSAAAPLPPSPSVARVDVAPSPSAPSAVASPALRPLLPPGVSKPTISPTISSTKSPPATVAPPASASHAVNPNAAGDGRDLGF